MVNSGSFDSDGRQEEAGCAPPGAATCRKSGIAQPADCDLPSTVAHAIEPTATKTEFNSAMTAPAPAPAQPAAEPSLCCSVPLDKVRGVLAPYRCRAGEAAAAAAAATVEKAQRPRKLLCLYCDRSFASAKLRQKHVERAHSAKKHRRASSRRPNGGNHHHQQREQQQPCVYCDKLTGAGSTLNALFEHLVDEHPTRYFGCLRCEDRFLTAALLADHDAVHHARVPAEAEQFDEEEEESTPSMAAVEAKDEPPDEIEKGVQSKKTRSRTKSKTGEDEENERKVEEGNLKKRRNKLKELRNKKLSVKSSKIASKRRESKRLRAMTTKAGDPKKKSGCKTAPESGKQTQQSIGSEPIGAGAKSLAGGAVGGGTGDKSKGDSVNPYPEFDNFYRVKKITDHSIDNLKISSLTFDDVFDKAFFDRIKCNIEENLLHHIDGKLFENEESESRISNFEKVSNAPAEVQHSNPESFGCELSLNAVAPIASLSLSSQFGEDFESQIEYGSKPSSKKKTQARKDEIRYKYFTRRKYQASILEHKENRDLSKLDMWTQLAVKKRQQKMLDDKKSAKEMLEYAAGAEYKSKLKREELNRILDRRGPFEDLKEEASKKAALEKLLDSNSEADAVNQESLSEIREVLDEILNGVFSMADKREKRIETVKKDAREVPSHLDLRRASGLPSDGEMDESDRIALICSSQETENFELPTNRARAKDEPVELTGEWARSRMYVCAACGAKLPNMKRLLEHKSALHQHVWAQHYEFVGTQSELYRHLSIPALGKIGAVEKSAQCKSWKRSGARTCTKCGKRCNSLGELHRHLLECGGDWTWTLARKKCKYRPYGARSRRKRRGLFSRIRKQKTEPSEKKSYKKTFEGPRQRPSDADTIERMLANLPAKRSTRKLISLQEGIYRSRKKSQASGNASQKKMRGGKVMYKSNASKERNEKSVEVANVAVVKSVKTKTLKKVMPSNNKRTLRSLSKVLSSRILDTSSSLSAKRKIKVMNSKAKASDSGGKDKNAVKTESKSKEIQTEARETRTEVKRLRVSPRSASKNVKNKSKVKKLLTGKISIKSFFPVKKRKPEIQREKDISSKASIKQETDILTRSKRKSNGLELNFKKDVLALEQNLKKTKSDSLSSVIINKIKVGASSKKPIEAVRKTVEKSIPLSSNVKSEEEKASKKRKLRQSFKSVINKVKKLNIKENSDRKKVADAFLGEKSQPISCIVRKVHGSDSQTELIAEQIPPETPALPEEEATVNCNLEIETVAAEIPIVVPVVVKDQDLRETIETTESMFRMDSNEEKSLAVPAIKITDCEIANEVDVNKTEPITIETCLTSKVVPMVSPNVKGKIRKPAKGLNDCIAMLTNKLQQKTVDETKTNSIEVEENRVVLPISPVLLKNECILRIPTFRSQKAHQQVEEKALDLSIKHSNSEKCLRTSTKSDVSEDLLLGQLQSIRAAEFASSLDEIVERVVEDKQLSELDGSLAAEEISLARNNLDETIDFVVRNKQSGYFGSEISVPEKAVLPSKPRCKSERKKNLVELNNTNSRSNCDLKQSNCFEITTEDANIVAANNDLSVNIAKMFTLDVTEEKIQEKDTSVIEIVESKDSREHNDVNIIKLCEIESVESRTSTVGLESAKIVESDSENATEVDNCSKTRLTRHRRSFRKVSRSKIVKEKNNCSPDLDSLSNTKVIEAPNVESDPTNLPGRIDFATVDSKSNFGNEDEPELLENKSVAVSTTDSEDDIPLSAFRKPPDLANIVKENEKEDKVKDESVIKADVNGLKLIECNGSKKSSADPATKSTNKIFREKKSVKSRIEKLKNDESKTNVSVNESSPEIEDKISLQNSSSCVLQREKVFILNDLKMPIVYSRSSKKSDVPQLKSVKKEKTVDSSIVASKERKLRSKPSKTKNKQENDGKDIETISKPEESSLLVAICNQENDFPTTKTDLNSAVSEFNDIPTDIQLLKLDEIEAETNGSNKHSESNKKIVGHLENNAFEKKPIKKSNVERKSVRNKWFGKIRRKSARTKIDAENNGKNSEEESLNTDYNNKFKFEVAKPVSDENAIVESVDVRMENESQSGNNPPIEVKQKTRRKSKSCKKSCNKGQNDLFEDFALVIKKPKRHMTFTFPNKSAHEKTIPKKIPADFSEDCFNFDVSVEEMDMELDDIPITSNIIERNSLPFISEENRSGIDLLGSEDNAVTIEENTVGKGCQQQTKSKIDFRRKSTIKNKIVINNKDDLNIDNNTLPVEEETDEISKDNNESDKSNGQNQFEFDVGSEENKNDFINLCEEVNEIISNKDYVVKNFEQIESVNLEVTQNKNHTEKDVDLDVDKIYSFDEIEDIKDVENVDNQISEINTAVLEENKVPSDANESSVRTKSIRSAKAKAIEYIHNEALGEPPAIKSAKNKVDSAATFQSRHSTKKRKKTQKCSADFKLLEDTIEKNIIITDLVNDLAGLEELENSIERELNSDSKDNKCFSKTSFIDNLDDKINNDAENIRELRRSRRGSKKVASYNENDLIDPLLDEFDGKRKNWKKDKSGFNAFHLDYRDGTETKDSGKKMNSEELFDLLKASTNLSEYTQKSNNASYLNSLEDELNKTNFKNSFENILENSSILLEVKDIDKIYEFTESTDSSTVSKGIELDSTEKRKQSKKIKRNKRFDLDDSSVSNINISFAGSSVSGSPRPTSELAESTTTSKPSKCKKSKALLPDKSNYCEICRKSFMRIDNLSKHKRTLTHIQKLSELEAKEAVEKSQSIQTKNEEIKVFDEESEEYETTIRNKTCEPSRTSPHNLFAANNRSLKLADIISDVLNKPVPDISIGSSEDQREFRRYKSLGERKSFDSDNRSIATAEPELFVSKTTILEKQISLLENMIENRTGGGANYVDDVSVSSNNSESIARRTPSELCLKQDDSSNAVYPRNCLTKPGPEEDSFLKPTQYEEISEDSVNLRNYEDQKLRKTLNRDEELFLECCSLLKSGSEVSSYSNNKSRNKVLDTAKLKRSDEPSWFERKNVLPKPIFEVINDYSDNNSRIPTPLGDSYDDDASNSNTICSNWNVSSRVDLYEDVSQDKREINESFSFEEILGDGKTDLIKSNKSNSKIKEWNKQNEYVSNGSDSKKMITKGARKVFEGLKVSIPTEELNLEEVLNCGPRAKKIDNAKNALEALPEETPPSSSKSSRTARKSKPVKNKSQFGSSLCFKMNKKKCSSPSSTNKSACNSETKHDVYDFEETLDSTDIFTKPDFRTFRNMKLTDQEPTFKPESDTESYLETFSVECQSLTSSASSSFSLKKPKAQENITKKKCMIMGRIFKNAAKSKIEDVGEEIRDIPAINNSDLVENYVASCKKLIKNEVVVKPKLTEKEIDKLFDQLLEDKEKYKKSVSDSAETNELDSSSTPRTDSIKNEAKRKIKTHRNKKRARSNSDSTDDEFGLQKSIKKRTYRKGNRADDNCINLEQELKECIGVASRKSQRKCTSGKQNVLVEYWSSDDSQFEAFIESQRIEANPDSRTASKDYQTEETAVMEKTTIENPVIDEDVDSKEPQTMVCERFTEKIQNDQPLGKKQLVQHKKKLSGSDEKRVKSATENGKLDEVSASTNRRKRAAVNPLYHWSSSSEDESQDLIEVKPIREELEDDEDRPIQHGWIVGDSPKKLVTMLAQAKGKKTDVECVKEQGKKRTSAVS